MKEFGHNHIFFKIDEYTENNFMEKVNYYKKFAQDFDFIFSYDSYPDYAKLCRIFQQIKANVDNVQNCNFFLNIEDRPFTESDINVIQYLDRLLEINSIKLNFKEINVLWDKDEFQKPYEMLNNICENVKSLNLSPFEQFLCFYKESTNRVYNEEQKNESSVISRSIVGINNSDRIVCSGYADWLRAMCNYMQNPNIHCVSLPVNYFVDNNYKSSHKVNLVYIKDEKYNIDGLYYVDSCWDSKSNEYGEMKLTHCLIPIRDMLFTKGFKIKAIPSNEFAYLLDDNKPNDFLEHSNFMSLQGIEMLGFYDISKMRKKYAEKVIQQIEDYSMNKSQDRIDEIKESMETNSPFKNQFLEYSFLRYVCNKIKANSKPIEYSKYVKALQVVVSEYLKLPEENANKYIEEVFENTQRKSIEEFSTGTQNSQYITSKIEYDRRAEHIRQLKERRQKILEKRQQKLKQKQDDQSKE